MPDRTQPDIQVGQERALPDDPDLLQPIPPHPGLTPGAGGFGSPDGRIGDIHRMIVTSEPRTVVVVTPDGANPQEAVPHAQANPAPAAGGGAEQVPTAAPDTSTPNQAQGGTTDGSIHQSAGVSGGADTEGAASPT